MICLKLNKKTQLCLAAAFFYLKREIPLLELMLTVDIHLRKAKVALDPNQEFIVLKELDSLDILVSHKGIRIGTRNDGNTRHGARGQHIVHENDPPDTVRVLDSAAFYNCRRLRRVTLGPGVEGFGSDLFTNCRQLQTFRLRAAADAPTGLKKLLGAVSADITVELDGAQLFYPEYSEFLDENTPAHIFNHSIEGEGYRMRQCFTPGGAVDYAAFDASFAQACVGESEDKLCRLALGRLVQPFGLGDDARADYELYLTAHPEAAFRRAIDDRDEAALRLLVGLSLPTADVAVYCARVGWSAGAAVLLGRAKRAKKTYDFDDL